MQHHGRELVLTSSIIISSAFIPFLIQEHEACYKHSLSLKASSNLILIFTGGSTEQGVKMICRESQKSVMGKKKAPLLSSCALKPRQLEHTL